MTTTTAPRGLMPLAAHLREGRRRATRGAVALLIAVVIGYLLSGPILEIIRAPIQELALTRAASLNYDSVTGAFDLKLRVALLAGVTMSAPVWIYQLLAFLAPGMTHVEKRRTFGFLLAAIPLFLAGCTLGFLLFPRMVTLLLGFSGDSDSTYLTASYYVDFVLKVVLATGLAFVLPVLVVLLNFLGIVSSQTVRRHWRLVVVGIVVFGAIVTPSADVLSMFLVALPMALLFTLAVVLTHLRDRRISRRAATVPADSAAAL